MIKVASAAPMNSQPVANGFPVPPPSVPAGDAASAMAFMNPAVDAELPEVNEPKKPLNGGVGGFADVSSRDVQPTVVLVPPYPQIQAAPGQVLMFDRGLMEAVTNAQSFVAQTFAGARLLENHNGVLHFQVETEGLSWSYIFGQLERNRTALNIVDYSVS